MPDSHDDPFTTTPPPAAARTRRRRPVAGRVAGPPVDAPDDVSQPSLPEVEVEAVVEEEAPAPQAAAVAAPAAGSAGSAEDAEARPRRRRRAAAATPFSAEAVASHEPADVGDTARAPRGLPNLTFQAPEETDLPRPSLQMSTPAAAEPDVDLDIPARADEAQDAPQPARRRRRGGKVAEADAGPPAAAPLLTPADADSQDAVALEGGADVEGDGDIGEERPDDGSGEDAPRRRRRGRRGRGRPRSEDEPGEGADGDEASATDRGAGRATAALDVEPTSAAGEAGAAGAAGGDGVGDGEDGDEGDEGARSGTRRRRRRRRRTGISPDAEAGDQDDPPNTVVHVREPRSGGRTRGGGGGGSGGREPRDDGDGVRGVAGSTRLEAKRIRRRDGRTDARRRPPVLTESEFLARREAVERRMVVRRNGERTQVAMLEDGVLVEHYVTKSTATSYAGNIYLGKVQNVLTSMEAAFMDIGKGRNAVLYAGEVAAGEGGPVRIEQALKSGQTLLVQVTKDPVGHKGARLTAQVSLPGRFLVYVPQGPMTGISRKLPDTERSRLKSILKQIVPEDAGVIIRTAAEGASEEELTADVERLQAQWREITTKAAAQQSKAPVLLHGEPDLVVKTVRDLFNEDIAELVVQGESAYDEIAGYVGSVAPDLLPRVVRWEGDRDVFAALRVEEGLAKALERKVNLPSGGSLVIDRTEALTAIDVNTGRFTGSGGGNLEETVTRNNLEAAEEIVRQLRLRDIGGMVVVDFIDMVLESNRDLVLRRLVECLGRDRTKHQVSEVTSLGLVQLTRKRVGQGLLESFSEACPHCGGRGLILHPEGYDASAPPPVVRRGIPSPAAVAARVSASAAAAGLVTVADPEAEVGVTVDDGLGTPEDAVALGADPPGAAVTALAEGPQPGGDGGGATTPRRRRGGRRAASRDTAAPADAVVNGAGAPDLAEQGPAGGGELGASDAGSEPTAAAPPPVGALEASADEDPAVSLVPYDAEV